VGHGVDQWFVGEHPKLQSTWTGLIRLQFGIKGKDPAFMSEFDQRELIRDYQRNRLGRSTGDQRLMELLPLPSPSAGQWLYAAHSRLPWLTNRKVYTDYQAPRREKRILREIKRYRPKLVVFYGLGFRDSWSRIAQEKFRPTGIGDSFVAHRDGTLFALVPHPVAHGLTRDYFFKVGKMLASA
jgi:hypothetical protein